MALFNDEIRGCAERLDHAEKTRTPIPPSSLEHPGITIADNKIAPNGLALEAGQVVLAASFIRPIETRKRRHDPGRLWSQLGELLLRLILQRETLEYRDAAFHH